MTKARVRVEAKRLPQNASAQEREKNVQQMLKMFRFQCHEYGIKKTYHDYQTFTRKCDVRRRKLIAKKMTIKNSENQIL